MPSVGYAYEKFMQAMDSLEYAAGYLIRLRPEDLPDGELRRMFQGIHDDLTWVEAKGDEGRISATVRALNDEDAKAIANRIFTMFMRLRGIDPLSTTK
jgi:hypothetical protein